MSRAVVTVVLCWMVCLLAAPHEVLAAQPASAQPWVKRGVLLEPGFAGPRSARRLSAPSVVKLQDGRLRMYFWAMGKTSNAPEAEELHYIFAAEASPDNPFHWQLVKSEPMLGPAPTGNIRNKGPSFPFVVPRDDGPWLLYYAAWGSWAPPKDLSNRTGVAVSYDKGISWQVQNEPMLPLGKPGNIDAGLTGSVAVLRMAPSDYRMWYTAGERYQMVGDVYRGIVHIGQARSANGLNWVKSQQPALRARLDAVKAFEAVVSKPSVIVIDGVYHMWFSVFEMGRHGYRLAYARSTDGEHWERSFDDVLSLTPGEFDSTNQSYPNVVDMGEQLWMFYAGDSFGDKGIGLATLEKSALKR